VSRGGHKTTIERVRLSFILKEGVGLLVFDLSNRMTVCFVSWACFTWAGEGSSTARMAEGWALVSSPRSSRETRQCGGDTWPRPGCCRRRLVNSRPHHPSEEGGIGLLKGEEKGKA
jgi:hypothetical protein